MGAYLEFVMLQIEMKVENITTLASVLNRVQFRVSGQVNVLEMNVSKHYLGRKHIFLVFKCMDMRKLDIAN